MKIATYNVENLFDLQKSGHEYKEYIPFSQSNWDNRNYKTKLKNLSRVIKDIDADIIALEEIESKQALDDLKFQLKRDGLYYQYAKIANAKNTTIKVAILSKFPFVYTKELVVGYAHSFRNILEVKLKVNNEDLYIFVNHWKSKAGPESQRISYAKTLKKRIQELGNKNIIALGDFNSHYEEYKSFKRKRKLNDTDGITGINHILGTINYQKKSSATQNIKYNELYNLWYDIEENERYSYIYRGKKEALDNILISSSLLDHKGIDYKKDSLSNFAPKYLFKGKSIYRWQMSRGKVKKHKAQGYSDHLAVIAEFTLGTNQ
ncbi:endonuclease/exonuclease/phosphatase family protein [Sulfurimonas sp. C5]|uniref:endonuclease/exonuclease/phosphatase family protein n=1 Tax=Sulfurimonas sp. C5 TaxID=3036947 RepID=UPI002455D288|nr:endonuclease/exonuclease/phosphatase family protein [Sulfurimonas sp. C5]MDH4943587.1 endonuclease/exonuclease/phosphatase family protein [Sulfurimonas sp. C5]